MNHQPSHHDALETSEPMNQITLVRSQFDEALLRLLAQPESAAVFRVGVSRWVEGVDLLGTAPRIVPLRSLLAELPVRSQAPVGRLPLAAPAECRLLLSDTPTETLRRRAKISYPIFEVLLTRV
jgi:hypothetical protein